MNNNSEPTREIRSFLASRDPSVDRMCRPCPKNKVNLFGSVYEEDSESCTTDSDIEEVNSSSSSSLSLSQSEGALIYLRMRPVDSTCINYKLLSSNTLVTTQQDASLSSSSKNNIERHYTFTDIFEGNIDQHSVYETCIRKKIENEESFTVLTYGTSGSGKTFTLLGDLGSPGIIPRALENIFIIYKKNIYSEPAVKVVNAALSIQEDDCMRNDKETKFTLLNKCKDIHSSFARVQRTIRNEHEFNTIEAENKSVFIWITFVEIYNELVYDLMGADPIAVNGVIKRKNHKIVSNDGKVFIKDLTSVFVQSSEEAYKLLMLGLNKVQYASTAINSNSSRSHCIFSVDVISFSHPDIFLQSTYRFCDLAGSERLDKTGNVGNRLKEAQRINTSLMVLGRCLDAANANQKKRNADVIPFRDSKLTMLLQKALLGKEKLTMIVNIAPTEHYFNENLNVLKFSSIAKNIVFKQSVQEKRTRISWLASTYLNELSQQTKNDNVLLELKKLQIENERLKNEISRLENQLFQQEVELRNKLINGFQETLKEQNESWENRLAQKLENQLFHQEVELRNELIDGFQKTLKERNKSWENRLAQELATMKQIYESKIKNLKIIHRQELEAQYEELSKVKENVALEGENLLKKRRVSMG